MSTDILRKTPEPPKLRIGMLVAVTLEITMFCVFLYYKSVFGVLLCFLYAWFSATAALVSDLIDSLDS